MSHPRVPTILLALPLVVAAACDGTTTTGPVASPAAVRARVDRVVPGAVDAAIAASHGAPLPDLSTLRRIVKVLSPFGAPDAPPATTASRAGAVASAPALAPPAGLVLPPPRPLPEAVVAPIVRRLFQPGGGPLVGPGSDTVVIVDPGPHQPPRPVVDGAQVAAYLEEVVFTDANFHDGAFTLPPGLLCGDDSACVDRVRAAELVVTAAPRGDHGLDLSLGVGPDHAPALTVSIDGTSAQAFADLGALRPAIAAVFAPPSGGAPADAHGVIDADLAFADPRDLRASVSFDESLHVDVPGPDGSRLTFDSAAASPAITIHRDVPGSAATGAIAVGPTRLTQTAAPQGNLVSIYVPGLHATGHSHADGPTIIEGLTLDGPAAIAADGRVFSLALDAAGRAPSRLAITQEPDTGAVVIEAPELDARVTAPATALAPEHVTGLRLTAAAGDTGALRFVPGTAGHPEVVGGTLVVVDPVIGGSFEAGTCIATTAPDGASVAPIVRRVECAVDEAR